MQFIARYIALIVVQYLELSEEERRQREEELRARVEVCIVQSVLNECPRA
jgi:hypothetical protein